MKPTRKIMLDRERTMAWTMKSMRVFEEVTGVKFRDVAQNPSAWEQTVMIWSTLVLEDDALTPEQVEDMIHGGVYEEASNKFGQLFAESTPDVAPSAKNKTRPRG